MDDNIKVGISTFLVTLIAVLGGVELFEDDVYYCEDRDKYWPCNDFSKYYSLPNGKCLNEEEGNRLCRSGWEKDNKNSSFSDETENEKLVKNPKIWCKSDGCIQCFEVKNNV